MDIAVLEIVDDLGALTEGHLGGGGNGGIQNQSSGHSGRGVLQLVGNGGEGEAVEATDIGVRQGQNHVIGLHNDLVGIVVSSHADLYRLAVRNHHDGSIELNGGRNDHLELDGTDLLTVVVSGDRSGADGAVGGEHAVSEATVDCGVGQTLGGQRSESAGGVNALDVHGNRGTGGDHVVGSSHGNMIEQTGCLRVGHHDDTVDGSTGRTVRGNVAQGVVRLTLALGQELRGSAAVTVDSPDATQRQHHLADLVAGQTNSVGSVTTLGLADDQGTVCLDTDHGAVSGRGGTLGLLGDQLAILNDEAEVTGNSLPLVAVKGLGGGPELELDRVISILGHSQIGLGVTMEGGGCENLAIPHHEAGGSLVVICQCSVHTADDVVAQLVAVVVHLLLHDLSGPVSGVGQILVDGIVGRQHADVGVIGVNLNDVQNLSTGTGIVVQNDLGLDRAVAEHVVIVGDHVVVIIRLGLIKGSRQSTDGNQREHHERAQCEGNDLGKDSVLHCFSPYFFI